MMTRHTIGEGLAYFRWHCLRYPHCPPFAPPRPWRLGAWQNTQAMGAIEDRRQAGIVAQSDEIERQLTGEGPLPEADVCPHCHQDRCGCDDPASHAGTSHLPDEAK